MAIHAEMKRLQEATSGAHETGAIDLYSLSATFLR
jgi:hypothetical protein